MATVIINPDGTITFTPAPNFNGPTTITYTISDGNGGTSVATVSVTVNSINDAPTVDTPLPAQSGVDSAAVSIPVAGNFSDLDNDTLTFTATGLPPGLSINPAGVITGTLTLGASQGGPNSDGIYTVSVTASDGNGGAVTTTFTYTVTNPAPTATNDTATTPEDTPVTIPVSGQRHRPRRRPADGHLGDFAQRHRHNQPRRYDHFHARAQFQRADNDHLRDQRRQWRHLDRDGQCDGGRG